MDQNKHQKLALRLGEILQLLNDGERLTVDGLAKRFNVHPKTIQRDLKNRLLSVDWVEDGPFYSINKGKNRCLSEDDLIRLADLLSAQNLFPSWDKNFFLEQLNSNVLVKGMTYESVENHLDDFENISEAIRLCKEIQFDYVKVNDNKIKQYTVEPYHLINKNGVWYLIALDQGREKTFCFTQIQNLEIKSEWFKPNTELLAKIKTSDSISHGNQVEEIELAIHANVAIYFQRRELLPNQGEIQKNADGSLSIVCKNVNPMEVMPIVQYWLPYVKIIRPIALQSQLKARLEQYLE